MQNLSSSYIALPIPEKMMKICPVVPENTLLIVRPLKKKKSITAVNNAATSRQKH